MFVIKTDLSSFCFYKYTLQRGDVMNLTKRTNKDEADFTVQN